MLDGEPDVQTAGPVRGGGQHLALLSLFAGVGTDRTATLQLLEEAPAGSTLAGAAFVEADSALSAATEAAWPTSA